MACILFGAGEAATMTAPSCTSLSTSISLIIPAFHSSAPSDGPRCTRFEHPNLHLLRLLSSFASILSLPLTFIVFGRLWLRPIAAACQTSPSSSLLFPFPCIPLNVLYRPFLRTHFHLNFPPVVPPAFSTPMQMRMTLLKLSLHSILLSWPPLPHLPMISAAC